jgi:hypothetical protein
MTQAQTENTPLNYLPFKSFRDALLEIIEVGDTTNPFAYSLRLMSSLKSGVITHKQFDGLTAELRFHIQQNKLQSSINNALLF